MPQILVADVSFAARLQSLDFVKNYVAKVQIIPELCKFLGNYFPKNALTRSFAVLQFCRLDIKVSRIGKPYNEKLYIL